jgi:DNA invertase Pin-like site-specific DNA recombinase
MQEDQAKAQLRAGVHARLSETYDAAESVPTKIERGSDHATRRGWTVAVTFKDDGYSGFKEITRDGFGELIAAIEAGQVDVVIVRDIDRLTRNLTDWNAFEKACVRHGVRLSAYTGGDLDLCTAEGTYYGGMETLRARRESAVKSARVCEAQDREARKGRRVGGGQRWFGYTRIYANPDEPNHKKRHILREEINPVEADAIRDAAMRVLDRGESVASIARYWTAVADGVLLDFVCGDEVYGACTELREYCEDHDQAYVLQLPPDEARRHNADLQAGRRPPDLVTTRRNPPHRPGTHRHLLKPIRCLPSEASVATMAGIRPSLFGPVDVSESHQWPPARPARWPSPTGPRTAAPARW